MHYIHPKKPPFVLRPHHHILMIGGFLLILFGGYIFFQGRDVFFGPTLFVEEPKNGALIDGAVLVRGKTEPYTKVFINEYEAMSNDQGIFEETLPLVSGYHLIEIITKNKFNKEARIVRQIVVK
jgi:hypothetical protein